MSLNRKHFINWQQLITYIRNNTGYDTEIIENVLGCRNHVFVKH